MVLKIKTKNVKNNNNNNMLEKLFDPSNYKMINCTVYDDNLYYPSLTLLTYFY